jgi:hypothetical protein
LSGMSTAPFVARTPVDLIAMAPHLLGFHPQDSIVLMTFGPPGASFHARVDLPVQLDVQGEVTELLVGAVLCNHLDTAAVLLFSTDQEAARSQGELLVVALTGAGVSVVDVIRVEPERYFAALESDDDGTPYDISGHRLTAQRVFEGQVVQASREALADTLIGTDEMDADAVRRAAERFGDRSTDASPDAVRRGARAEALWIQGRIRRHLRGPRLLTVDEAGRMLALCQVQMLRDVAWAEMTRSNADAHVEFWRDLVRRAPTGLLPPAAALLGFAAWLSGDGALAWCAVERCAEVDPDYSMAHMVAEALTHALPPSSWTQIPEVELSALHDWPIGA